MTNQKSSDVLRIDGEEYILDDLPNELKVLVTYYNRWNEELSNLRIDVAKTESALKDAIRELKGGVARLRAQGDLKTVAELEASFRTAESKSVADNESLSETLELFNEDQK